MKDLTLEYNFFGGASGAKLIVSARERFTSVTAVIGAKTYSSSFPRALVKGTDISFDDAYFSSSLIRFSAALQGVRVSVNAEIDPETALNAPLGFLCGLGLSAYSIAAPAVRARLADPVRIGSLEFRKGDFAAVCVRKGAAESFPHTVITGADRNYAVYIPFGGDATWGMGWQYAVACVMTPSMTTTLAGTAKLVRFEDGADGMIAELASPTSALTVRITDAEECGDVTGYRYRVGAVGEFELKLPRREPLRFRIPAAVTHFGAVRHVVFERALSADPESVSSPEDCIPDLSPKK